MHASKISHRDIKPANIVLDAEDDVGPTRLILCDFGSTVRFGDPLQRRTGTHAYASNEVHAAYTVLRASNQQDMASIGYTLFAFSLRLYFKKMTLTYSLALKHPALCSGRSWLTSPDQREKRYRDIQRWLAKQEDRAFESFILSLIGPLGAPNTKPHEPR